MKNPCSAPLKHGQLVEVRLDSDEPLSVNVEGDWLVTVTELVTRGDSVTDALVLAILGVILIVGMAFIYREVD